MSTSHVFGNQRTKEVHRQTVSALKMIHSENLVPFGSINEALQEGYNGCGHCLAKYNDCRWSLESAPKSDVINEQIIDEENLIVGFSVTERRETWDVVIMGAGLIGLLPLKKLSISKRNRRLLKRSHSRKGEHCGSDRRAETINANHISIKFGGEGFLESITIARHQKNNLYAPWAKQNVKVVMLNAPHSFHWRGDNHQKGLIDRMEEILGISYNSKENVFPKKLE
ncbi:MAG: hypothetical protein U5L04_05800 [Trueperaceae bacterium]|nr:hypothetical protein [Trueperaceae bacterium]